MSNTGFEAAVVKLYTGVEQPTVGQIAKQLGVGYSVIYRVLKMRGIKRRPKGPARIGFLKGSKSDMAYQLLVTNHHLKPGDAGYMSQADIADAVGCTRELVKGVYTKMKERGMVDVTWRTTA